MGVPKETPKWTKPEYRRQVEEYLRDYLPLKESLQDREMVDLFPSCIPVYGEEGSCQNNSSSTERYALLRVERHSWEKQVFVQQMEKALDTLNEDERAVIEKTYFDELCVVMVCDQLRISPATYRRIKSRAIDKIAIVLNLI